MDDNLKEAMVNDLLDVIDNKLLNEQTIGNFSHWYLQALLEITRELENGRDNDLFTASQQLTQGS